MSIPTGRYKIVTTEDTHVSRANEEASDLDPKPIYTNTDDQDPTWVVEQLHNGNYILYVKSTPTAIMGDAVFALIIGQANRTEWHLAHHRDDSFRYLRHEVILMKAHMFDLHQT